MNVKVTDLQPGQWFIFEGCKNPYVINHAYGTVETTKIGPDYVIITTTDGRWIRIHRSHHVRVESTLVTI